MIYPEPAGELISKPRISWPYRQAAKAAKWLFTTPTYEPDTLEQIAVEGATWTCREKREARDENKKYKGTIFATFDISIEDIEMCGQRRAYNRQKSTLKKISKSAKKKKTSLETLEANVDYLYNNHSDQETATRDIQKILGVDGPDSDDNPAYRTPAGESYAHTVVANFAKNHDLTFKDSQMDKHVKAKRQKWIGRFLYTAGALTGLAVLAGFVCGIRYCGQLCDELIESDPVLPVHIDTRVTGVDYRGMNCYMKVQLEDNNEYIVRSFAGSEEDCNDVLHDEIRILTNDKRKFHFDRVTRRRD
jgi:hypothetical protein